MTDRVTPRAWRVLAPNPGPMTLEGTNTWLLAEPGAARAVVVDPGPDDEGHLAAVLAAAAERERSIALVLLTHGHPDHSGGAAALAARTGAPVRAVDQAYRINGGGGLADGAVVTLDGLALEVVATPGHTADSVCLLLPADGALITGDTLLGRGWTVVAHPDGRLADYLSSLRRLRSLCADTPVPTLLPGHGPVRRDAVAVIDAYLGHRAERLAQVRAAVAGGTDAAGVVRQVYADVDPALWPAAEQSVRAQLDYLSGR